MTVDDVAGSLIDALADEGEHVDDGGFTLDSAAALAKLREHQLADPHGYLLLLVEAAWLAAPDPTRGQVRVEVGTITSVEFTGVALAPGSLRDLFAAVFGTSNKLDGEPLRAARVLQLLGLAANNALALEPKQLVIEASDAEGRSERVRVAPDGTLSAEPGALRRPRGVRFEYHGGMLDLGRTKAERALLEQRCRYTRLAVHLDDRLVSADPRASLRSAPTTTSVLLDDTPIGVAGQLPDPRAAGTTWIVNRGVMVRDPNFGGLPGVLAVVEVDLPMDLSRKQFLRGPELDAVRRAIRAARDAVPVRELPAPELAKPEERGRAMAVVVTLVAVLGVVFVSTIATRSTNPAPQPATVSKLVARCQAGDLEACDMLVGPPSRQQRLELACEGGDQRSCAQLRASESPSPELPLAEQQSSSERLCRLGRVRQCVLAAELSRDPDLRLELFELGCAGDQIDACERLVEVAREQTRFAIDREPLRAALVRTCLAFAGPECLEAAWYQHYGFVDPNAAADLRPAESTLLERGCRAELARACALQAGPSLAEGCEADEALACYALGLAGFGVDAKLDAEYRRLCAEADADQCAALERRRFALTPAALAALDKACELALPDGCFAAGAARLWGLGQPEDLGAAERDFARACTLELGRGCDAERFVAELHELEPEQRRALEPDYPSFPKPLPPSGAEPWTP